MPPTKRQEFTSEALSKLERACPTTDEARAKFIMALTQDQVEGLLMRAHERVITEGNKRWINDLSARLANIIKLRGGQLISQQFSHAGGK
jgi:hypothetical protein